MDLPFVRDSRPTEQTHRFCRIDLCPALGQRKSGTATLHRVEIVERLASTVDVSADMRWNQPKIDGIAPCLTLPTTSTASALDRAAASFLGRQQQGVPEYSLGFVREPTMLLGSPISFIDLQGSAGDFICHQKFQLLSSEIS
jgi:hypothetical protein